MSDRRARTSARRAVRSRRRELEAAGVAPADAYATVRAEARGGALGDLPPGWVHEDFHLDDKDAVFAAARSGAGKIDAVQVVAASRVYTPGYIVDFLLQNTLGALWLQMHPTSALRAGWPLLVERAVGPARAPRPVTSLSVLDPCCGCGAFLLPALDMLVAMAHEERALARAGEVPATWVLGEEDLVAHLVAGCISGADLDGGAVAILRDELRRRGGGAVDGITVVEQPLGSLAPDAFGGRRFDVVCTNPPFVGFRQLAPEVSRAVRANVPDAGADLAVAFQARCADLVADGGRCGTVTPAGWTNGRQSVGLRRRILRDGGPCVTVALGQRVFDSAPLVFVSLNVTARGNGPGEVSVVRPAERSATGIAAALDGARAVSHATIAGLASAPFLPDAPQAVLDLARRGPRVGDRFRSFDGVWTGANARDLRFWWQVGEEPGWARLSGGQGHQPWVAPIRLRIRAEHVVGQPERSGGVEYPRVAGGRLGARVAEQGTASLAGVVTFLPREDAEPGRVGELLALFNSSLGGAWLRTLTSGLNFNPGYAAELPLAADSPGVELRDAVDEAVALRRRLVCADPTHDAFLGVPHPDEVAGWVAQLVEVECRVEVLLAGHLRIGRDVTASLPPTRRNRLAVGGTDDALMVAALRARRFRWPESPVDGDPATPEDVVEAVAAALTERNERDVDPARWCRDRLEAVLADRFKGTLAVSSAAALTPATRSGVRAGHSVPGTE